MERRRKVGREREYDRGEKRRSVVVVVDRPLIQCSLQRGGKFFSAFPPWREISPRVVWLGSVRVVRVAVVS